MSPNTGMELLLYAMQYVRTVQMSHDDLAVQALVWLHTVRLRATGLAQSSLALHTCIYDDLKYLTAKCKE